MRSRILAATLAGLFAAPCFADALDAPVREADPAKVDPPRAQPAQRTEQVAPVPAGRRWAPALAGAGAVIAITGTFMLFEANRVSVVLTPEQACGGPCDFVSGERSPSAETLAEASRLRFAGGSLVAVGAAALVTAGVLYFTGAPEPKVQVAAVAVNGNWLVTVSGKLP